MVGFELFGDSFGFVKEISGEEGGKGNMCPTPLASGSYSDLSTSY